jgi:Tachylectin
VSVHQFQVGSNWPLRCAVAVLAHVLAVFVQVAVSAAQDQYLVRAISAEGQAPRKRVVIEQTVGTQRSRKVLTRIASDKFRLETFPAHGPASDMVIFEDKLYLKRITDWLETKAPPSLSGAGFHPDLSKLLSKVIATGFQSIDGLRYRAFSGPATWPSNQSNSAGTLEILINAQTGILYRSTFSGQCGTLACSFIQAFEFGDTVTLDAPGPVFHPNAIKLYASSPENALAWQEHLEALSGKEGLTPAHALDDPMRRYGKVSAAIGEPVIYALADNGDLLWFRHEGFADGKNNWSGPSVIARDWRYDAIIAGEGGVIYGRSADGRLYWHRHLDPFAGDPGVSGPEELTAGWDGFRTIMAANNGVLYGIRSSDASLWWRRHEGFADGSNTWSEEHKVGVGWTFKTIASAGQGFIYAIDDAGDLWWYHHRRWATGIDTGGKDWDDRVKLNIGWGAFDRLFALRINSQ